MTIVDVLADNGATRFRIYDHGKNVGAMFAGQCAGKFLIDTLPEAARAHTVETYEYAAWAKLPVFTISKVADVDGREVLYERLLLPFSDFGQGVFRIIAFLETISYDGAFERRRLMTERRPSAGYAIKAVLHIRPVTPG